MSICFIFLCVRRFIFPYVWLLYLPVSLVALSFCMSVLLYLPVCLLYLPVCLLALSSCFSYLLVSPSVSCSPICLLYFPVCRFDSFFSFSSFSGMVASLLPRPTSMLSGHPVCLDICEHFLLLFSFSFVVCNHLLFVYLV